MTISFARGGPGTRAVQIFINLGNNARLDTLNGFGFPPIAEVVSGMATVDSLYSGYGEAAPRSGSQFGREGPSQDSIVAQGNAYLSRGWPKRAGKWTSSRRPSSPARSPGNLSPKIRKTNRRGNYWNGLKANTDNLCPDFSLTRSALTTELRRTHLEGFAL